MSNQDFREFDPDENTVDISDEIIEEIEKLKKNGFTEQYINNYIYLARNMVKYFEKY